jgi:hypothetical protein
LVSYFPPGFLLSPLVSFYVYLIISFIPIYLPSILLLLPTFIPSFHST